MSTIIADSVVSFRNSQGDKASGTLRGITRRSVSLEVYNPHSVAQLSEMLSDLTVRREGRVVYQGSAVVTTLINTGIYLVMSATLTDPWKDLTNLGHDSTQIKAEVRNFLKGLEQFTDIHPGFEVIVTRMRTHLSELSRWLQQVDVMMEESFQSKNDREIQLLEEISEPIVPLMLEQLMEFESIAKDLDPESVSVHSAFVQRELHPLIMRSPFMHRVYTKPLGYAGDYEMVNMMLRDPYEGPNIYYKIVNKLFLMEGPSVAHKNRVKIMHRKLEALVDQAKRDGKTIKIFNLGCGPAVEVQRLLNTRVLDERTEITLMDFNDQTLGYTKSLLDKIGKNNNSFPKITYEQQSVDQILRQSARLTAEESNKYDFIYCAGLFDYFSDRACSRVLKLFYKLVKPGGEVLSTNVHSDNPAIAAMEYLVEWYLVYRDEQQMLDLVSDIPGKKVYGDETGLNIFLEFSKEAGQ